MTTEELRAAYEMAGLECWYSATHGQRVGQHDENGREIWSLPEDHVTLPAYIASVLLFEVDTLTLDVSLQTGGDDPFWFSNIAPSGYPGDGFVGGSSTIEEGMIVAIIRACVRALDTNKGTGVIRR